MTDTKNEKTAQASATSQEASKASGKKAEGSAQDVVVVHGVTDDQKGLRVLRARESGVELGEVRPVVEGAPIHQDIVRLVPRKETPFVCDVETEVSAKELTAKTPPTKGPAQVATRAYRDNWDAIWSNRVSAPGSSELN